MKQVLLIEDDAWLAESYRRVMTKAGLRVRVVGGAETAMQAVEKKRPDVIVADVMLEGHTVVALLHEMQSYDDTAKIPVILCSSLGSDVVTLKKFRSYGVRQVLDKTTLTADDIVTAVAEAAP